MNVCFIQTRDNNLKSNNLKSNNLKSNNQTISNQTISNQTILNQTILNQTISNQTILNQTILNQITSQTSQTSSYGIIRAMKLDYIYSLNPALFWDVEVDSINADTHKRYVIERVLQRGELSDIQATVTHYTMPVVIFEAQQIRSLDPVTLAFAACLGNVKEDSFRCYALKQ